MEYRKQQAIGHRASHLFAHRHSCHSREKCMTTFMSCYFTLFYFSHNALITIKLVPNNIVLNSLTAYSSSIMVVVQ